MIQKFQLGGQQDAIMQFVQGLALVLLADPQQVVQAAQQNPKALEAAVQTYLLTQDMNLAAQVFTQAMLQQVLAARHGAKLQYLKSLKNQCPEGEELYYYKKGGSVGCGCKKKEDGGVVNKGPITKDNPSWKTNFENRKKKQEDPNANTTWDPKLGKRRKMTPKEIAKAAKNRADARKGEGEGTPERKCGGKVKKNEDGSKINKNCGGSAIAKFKMHRLGGTVFIKK